MHVVRPSPPRPEAAGGGGRGGGSWSGSMANWYTTLRLYPRISERLVFDFLAELGRAVILTVSAQVFGLGFHKFQHPLPRPPLPSTPYCVVTVYSALTTTRIILAGLPAGRGVGERVSHQWGEISNRRHRRIVSYSCIVRSTLNNQPSLEPQPSTTSAIPLLPVESGRA